MSAPRSHLSFVHRGQVSEVALPSPTMTLLDWLREEHGLVGTKEGCNEGDCGACTVVLGRLENGLLKRRAVNACILLLGQIDGAELITVEDVAQGATLHPVQAAMVKHHGSQCGFCTPGIVMSLFALYHDQPGPVSRTLINDRLAGNLCRCTGYRPIIDAALEACAQKAEDKFSRHAGQITAQLAALAEETRDLFIGDERQFFAAPRTIETAAALAERHHDAVVLGGATDVGLWVTKRLQPIAKIIWLGHIEHMRAVTWSKDGLTLGAGVVLDVAHEALSQLDPDLAELMRRFGSMQVRNSGTVGGNLANGSPIGDLAPALIALGARLHLRLGAAQRVLPVEDFFLAYGRQDRRPGELLESVHVPRLASDTVFRCFKVSKRFDEDISAVMGAFHFTVKEGEIITSRLAYGGMAGVPKRARLSEAALAGMRLKDTASWQPALVTLAQDFTPLSDARASAAYRLKIAQVLLARALGEAAGLRADKDRLIAPRQQEAQA